MSQFGAEYDALMATAMQPPTMVEQKANGLEEARKGKLSNISPEAFEAEEIQRINAEYEKDYETGTGGSNLLDAAQASIYKTGQGFGELGRDVGSGLAGFMGLDTAAETLDEIEFASDEDVNKMWGYDPTDTQQKMQAVSEAYDRGDILGTAGAALAAAPGVLAESAGPLLTMAFGGVGLLGKAAQTAQKGAKLLKAEQAVVKSTAKFNIKTTKAGTGYRIETLKDSLKAQKALSAKIVTQQDKAKTLNTLDNLIRINKGTVALGVSDANQQLNEYKANNNGESAGFIRAVTSGVVNTALYGLEFNILKGIGKGALKDISVDLAANTLKAALTGNSKTIAKSIAENTLKIAGAAGAEAGQEYAQTWTQILTEKAGTSKYGDLGDVLGSKEFQKEANISAILGGATGGALRAAPIAVTAPVKAATTVASKTIEKVATVATEKAIAASYGVLSADERTALKEKFDAENKAMEETNAVRQTQIDKIGEAKTIEELRALGDTKIDEAINSTMAKSQIAPKLVETINKITGADTLETIAKASAYGQVLIGRLSKDNKSKPKTVEEIKTKVLEHLNSRLDKSEVNILKPRIESIKNAAIAQYNKDIDVAKVSGTFTKGRDIVQKVATSAYEKAKGLADVVPQEAIDKIVTLAKEGKELTTETIEAVVSNLKDADKSIARALLDDLISDKPKRATRAELTKLGVPTLEAIKTMVKTNPKALRVVESAIERKKQVRSQFFGEEAKVTKEKVKATVKKATDAAMKAVKDKVKSLIGQDATDQLTGLKGIVVEAIKDSETIAEVKTLIADIKKEGKELGKEAKETLDKIEVAVLAKAIELEQTAKEAPKKKTETTVETTIANYDLATISLDEFNKVSIDSVEFMYALTMEDIKALGKNPNLSDAVKQAITIEYINMQAKEAEDVKKTGDKASANVDTLLNDDIIKQIQNEEGCL